MILTVSSRSTPVIADLKPGGRYMAPDMAAAGGSALLGRRLKEAGPDQGCAHRHRRHALRLGVRGG